MTSRISHPSDTALTALGTVRGADKLLVVLAGMLVLLGVAFWLYRPDAPRSFDLVDFPFTLPFLQERSSFSDRVAAYTAAMVPMGRFNPASYVHMAGQWSLFGTSTAGWQWFRFFLMCAVGVVAYLLLRRLELPRSGAVAGASIYVVAPAATRGWTWLTAAEPMGTLLLLLATCLILRPPPATRVGRAASLAGVTLLVGTIVLTKELLIAACLLPLIVAGFHATASAGTWRRHLIGAGFLGATVALIPVAYVFLSAPPSAYAARYARSGLDAFGIVGSLWLSALPFMPQATAWPIVNAFAFGAFVVFVVTGWTHLLRRTPREMKLRLLAIAVGLPLVGAAAYAPWPSYTIGYALPYLFGGAVIVAGATAGLAHARPLPRAAGALAGAIVLVFSAAGAVAEVRPTQSLLLATRQLIPLARTEAGGDTILIAVSDAQVNQPNPMSLRFAGLARAYGDTWPHVSDVSCENAERTARGVRRVLLVRISMFCDPMGPALKSIAVGYSVVDWQSMRAVQRALVVDLVRPTGAYRANPADRPIPQPGVQ